MRTEINEVQQKYNFTKLSNSQHLHFERGVYTTTAFETIQLEDEKACRRVAFGSSVRPKVLWRWWSDFDYCSLSQEQLLLIVVVRGACSNFHPKPASLLYPVVWKPKHPQGHPGYLFPFHSCQKWLNSILIPYLLNTYTPEMRALARATRHRLDTSPAAVCFSRNLAL